MKKVLVLGAGLVARPLLEELDRRGDVELVVAALNGERARQLASECRHAQAVEMHTDHRDEVAAGVANADLVVSLLPAPFHPGVARLCLEKRRPLVTTSYVSPEMQALDGEARERGVLLLNECGLDPGIDHMMAAEAIRRLQAEGGVIESFASYAGGLPAPAYNDNPWGYKCSWTPRGVLVSASSSIRHLLDGEIVERQQPYRDGQPMLLEVEGVGRLEVYPTRDSLPYREKYGLREARNLFRGTLRYPGWCATFRALIALGLLDQGGPPEARTYAELIARRLPEATSDRVRGSLSPPSLRDRVAVFLRGFLAAEEVSAVVERLEWLGLLADEPLPSAAATALDAVAVPFGEKLRYQPGERDLVVLEHRFVARLPDGHQRGLEMRLVVEGDAGDHSAMAVTVGTPAALAAGMILDGEVPLTGVHIPVAQVLSGPILSRLGDRGIRVVEKAFSPSPPTS
jgi:saccharopine dehydrogenase (NADP+, L-glutamate forming)